MHILLYGHCMQHLPRDLHNEEDPSAPVRLEATVITVINKMSQLPANDDNFKIECTVHYIKSTDLLHIPACLWISNLTSTRWMQSWKRKWKWCHNDTWKEIQTINKKRKKNTENTKTINPSHNQIICTKISSWSSFFWITSIVWYKFLVMSPMKHL